ncbi:efflux RND transporter periplasmic adaptor subunit [Deminuibacter soli]|nr:efflux RND transporter periplasmic adaptor subunit [Deminuibacter soli]
MHVIFTRAAVVFRSGYIAAVLVILQSCSSPGGKQHNNTDTGSIAIPVVVSRTQSLQQAGVLVLSGSAEANTTTNASFSVSGKATTVVPKEGDAIDKGVLLAALDAASYQYSLDAANAELMKATDVFNRATIMKNRESLTEADYQKATAALQQAQALQKQATKALHDTRLYAPASGIVAKRNIEPGENVAMGIPVFTIVSIQPVYIKANVPEAEIARVHKGQTVQVTIPALNRQFSGTITEIGAVADAVSRAYTVKVTVPNKEQQIRAGMIANATLQTNASSTRTMLPGTAVLHDPDGTSFLFIADSLKKRAYKRNVSIGQLAGSEVEITSGLTGSELIVTGGQQKLQDGAFIEFKAPHP